MTLCLARTRRTYDPDTKRPQAVQSRHKQGCAARIFEPTAGDHRMTIRLRDDQTWRCSPGRCAAGGSPNGHRVAGRRPVSGSGTEAREAATERAVLRMVALGVLAAQAARFRYADG
jgi:hypothetical protein